MGESQLDPALVVNLESYPIEEMANPLRAALVERLRNELDSQQYCVLPDFMTADALAPALKEIASVKASAFKNRSHRNCYLYKEKDPALPDDHPTNIHFDASYAMIGHHLLPENSVLKQLYYWPPMMHFVAEVVGVEALYPNVDKYQPVNVNCYADGDQSAWHFDAWNAFTMTLMLQAAEAGGDFEIVPNIRSGENANHDELSKVLRGDRSRVVKVARAPRALVIFRGCNSLHRVAPVSGPRDRLMAVFVYEEQPGVGGDPRVNETVYGIAPETAPTAQA